MHAAPLPESHSIDAAGAFVIPRSPRRVFLLATITGGLYGAIWHGWTNAELGQYGRARGRMPFPYIDVSQIWACVAFVVGWAASLLLWAQVIFFLFDGEPEGIADWMSIASSMVLAAPLWATARGTMQRIGTARMLAGISEPTRNASAVGAIAVVFAPLYCLIAQRAINPVWALYPPAASHVVLQPHQIAHEIMPATGLLANDAAPVAPVAPVNVYPVHPPVHIYQPAPPAPWEGPNG